MLLEAESKLPAAAAKAELFNKKKGEGLGQKHQTSPARTAGLAWLTVLLVAVTTQRRGCAQECKPQYIGHRLGPAAMAQRRVAAESVPALKVWELLLRRQAVD